MKCNACGKENVERTRRDSEHVKYKCWDCFYIEMKPEKETQEEFIERISSISVPNTITSDSKSNNKPSWL